MELQAKECDEAAQQLDSKFTKGATAKAIHVGMSIVIRATAAELIGDDFSNKVDPPVPKIEEDTGNTVKASGDLGRV